MKQAELVDWYSGSDNTGVVSSKLDRALKMRASKEATQQDIDELKELLKTETADNWLGYIWSLIGIIQFDLELDVKARSSFSRAMRLFKPQDNANWNLALDDLYCLASAFYGDLRWKIYDVENALKSYMICLQHLDDNDDDDYEGSIHYAIGLCMNQLDRDKEARSCFEKAYPLVSNKCSTMDMLMIVNYNLGDIEAAISMYNLLLNDCEDYKAFEQVREFGKTRLGIEDP